MVPQMPQTPPSVSSTPLRSHLFFAILGMASIALFEEPLRRLVSLSLNDERYSHLILIPVISAFFVYRERGEIFSRSVFQPWPRLPFLIAALAIYGLLALRLVHAPASYTLSSVILSVILVWAAGFAVCYGTHTFMAAMFPISFLLLLVPIPFDIMDRIVTGLQSGSAWATYALFKLAGVPVFRVGVNFELPGIGIEIAKECSSVHSGWALFIMGLLVAHMFLKSMWAKFCLTVFTVPIAMGTNAVRIATLWFLGTHVDVGFLYGNLHHHGGVVFSLISLSVLMGLLGALRKIERRELPASGAGKDHVKLIVPPGGQAASLP